MSDDNSTLVSRRAALKALAAVAVCPAISACEFVDVFDTDFADATPFSVDDPGLEALDTVGNTACFEHGAHDLVLVRVNEDEILAFNRLCPHQNLDMGDCEGNPFPGQWDPEQQTLTCQWHGSTFNRDGELVEAPGTDPDFDEPVQVFPVDFDPDTGEGLVLTP